MTAPLRRLIFHCRRALAPALAGLLLCCAAAGATPAASVPAPQTPLTEAKARTEATAPKLPPLLVREADGWPRVIVRLPQGTATFVPEVVRVGGVVNVPLPAEALPPVRGSGAAWPPQTVQLTPTRTLEAQWSPRGLTLAGLEAGEDVRAVLWPAAGGLPPQLALLWSEAGSRPQVIMPRAAPQVQATSPEPRPAPSRGLDPQIGAAILGDLQAQMAQYQRAGFLQSGQEASEATPPAPEPTQPKPTLGPVQPTVVLDAGHGGSDPGMTSRWVREADVNLDVALRTARTLESAGVQVVLTRHADVHLHPQKAADLELRSRMATTGQASAFISIHVNAATHSAAHGIETYYFGQPPTSGARSLAVRENGGGEVGTRLTAEAGAQAEGLLGDLLGEAKLSFSRQLATLVQRELVLATGARNRGVKQDAFYVIRRPTTPAILTELGFGSNPTEGQRLANPQYREAQAQAIARAVVKFLNASG